MTALRGWLAPWTKRLARTPFALTGLLLMAVKFNLDRWLAKAFGGLWSPWTYWDPGVSMVTWRAQGTEPEMFGWLLASAVPFILVGLAMTCARLRDAGLTTALLPLFFIPWVNLLFFAVLALVPSRESVERPQVRGPFPGWIEGALPRGPFGAAFGAAAVVAPIVVALAWFGVSNGVTYGWGLFVGAPFVLGCLAAYVFGYRVSRSRSGALFVAFLAIVIVSSLMVAFVLEGIVCLLMSAPLAIPLALAGGLLGWSLAERRHAGRGTGPALLAISAMLSLQLGVERVVRTPEPIREVVTAVELDAPPEVVWPRVVAFPPLDAPDELLFRAGIASPMSASINGVGAGAGAVRRCEFSTGAFVEPITVWDAPHVLRFDVTKNPPPLTEWNPFGHVNADHLHGTFEAVEGEFRLVRLPSGGTRLEGRTWYRNAMVPRLYWALWSDAAIHRIHARVLDHVGRLAESDHRGERATTSAF